MSYNTDPNSSVQTENIQKSFGQDGCQVVFQSGEKCGEQDTLQICKQFNEIYANKLKEFDTMGAGDCTEVNIFIFIMYL